MNIKDKSDLVDTSKLDEESEDEITYYNVKIRRLQLYQKADGTYDIRVTIYDPQYRYLYFEFYYPNEEMRGIATYAGLLDALVKSYSVSLIATRYHGSQEVGFITGVETY
ncbi:hypothetical protein [Xenorhabdus sp. Sc-CR9]|uniref:hypothetical protein n=1 Tax=Xenorhabdus sp. Sc-CR9 TaxID=2584468 RepID=UPI001F2CA67A|nr:hypothetical protein [Xenorhabdus sp. Sc-CR9]